jgi:hypothetical protein
VGLIARYVSANTGRPVHMANVSTGGTPRDILHDQLQKVDLATADIVIVADANDMENRVPVECYRATWPRLWLRRLPTAPFTRICPCCPGAPYQTVLRETTDAHGIPRADFSAVFNGAGSTSSRGCPRT